MGFVFPITTLVWSLVDHVSFREKNFPGYTKGNHSCLWLQSRIAAEQLVPGHQEATSTVGGNDLLEPNSSNKQT